MGSVREGQFMMDKWRRGVAITVRATQPASQRASYGVEARGVFRRDRNRGEMQDERERKRESGV